jgi:hypothetical protein
MGAVVSMLPNGAGLDHSTLPDIASAKLPASYQQAKTAIAECWRIDEVKNWSDQAAALATYARMSEDETLEKMAMRVRARAIRRVGELLEQIPKAFGANQSIDLTGETKVFTRSQAAEDAGLDKNQRNRAVNVARVPEQQFEAQVESDNPPTIKALAEQGIKPRPKPEPLIDLGARTQAEFREAGKLIGIFDQFVREASGVDLGLAFRGLAPHEQKHVADSVDRASEWIGIVTTKGGFNV